MTTILADENVDGQIVARLRSSGLHVIYVAELSPGISDHEIFELARREAALLVTSDKDFGEIVFRQSKTGLGIVLLRLAGLDPASKAEHVLHVLQHHSTAMLEAFSVISPGAVRIRLNEKN